MISRNHFLALSFKNLMMLDYDKKDYVNPETAETEILNKLENLKDIFHFYYLELIEVYIYLL